MKNYYKILLQFFVVSLFSFASYSQSLISGVVVDGSTNEPLIGANVSIKGTTDGTFTGLDGSFSFSSNASGDVVLVSYIGYEDLELSNSGDLGMVKMNSLNISLDEVRVTPIMVLTEKLQLHSQMFLQDMLKNMLVLKRYLNYSK